MEMEWVALGDPGEAVSIQAPWATFYGARNNELLQRKTGNRITSVASQTGFLPIGAVRSIRSDSPSRMLLSLPQRGQRRRRHLGLMENTILRQDTVCEYTCSESIQRHGAGNLRTW
jgi:hypothetical protein